MMRYRMYEFFFFSSRRRHTRYWRDWSSDVCSSDLLVGEALQFLRAHDRADAGPPGEVARVVDDAGEADEVLAAWADQRGAGHLVAHFLADLVLRRRDVQAPDIRGVADLDHVRRDPQVDRLCGLAAHDDRVVAGPLQVRAGVAAGIGAADAAGQRRLRTDAVAALTGERRAGHDAGRHDEDVLRPERIGALRDELEQVV